MKTAEFPLIAESVEVSGGQPQYFRSFKDNVARQEMSMDSARYRSLTACRSVKNQDFRGFFPQKPGARYS